MQDVISDLQAKLDLACKNLDSTRDELTKTIAERDKLAQDGQRYTDTLMFVKKTFSLVDQSERDDLNAKLVKTESCRATLWEAANKCFTFLNANIPAMAMSSQMGEVNCGMAQSALGSWLARAADELIALENAIKNSDPEIQTNI